MMHRAILISFLVICGFLIAYSQNTLNTCSFYSSCYTEFFGALGCSVNLNQVTCGETDVNSRVTCNNERVFCKEDCDCDCLRSTNNYGYRGGITYFDPCVERVVIRTYDCNNCGYPYPFGTPTPTPTPAPIPTPVPTPVPDPPSFPLCTTPGWNGDCPPGTTENIFGQCCPSRGGGTCCVWTIDGTECCDSPILIDILGDGFALTNAAEGVQFDLDANGTQERRAWTTADGDDAWLAFDRDGNGTIDNGLELFGNYTPQPFSDTPNGFLALAEYDRAANGGNDNGMIDSGDAIFASLRLWQDMNHNGVSESDELHTLLEFDIAVLHLDYKESKKIDEYGNQFRYRAKVDDVKGAKANRRAWDVFLTSQ